MTEFTPHEATAREAQALPVMLPSRLVGREATLAQVYAQLKEGNTVLIHGIAGVGKTGLAATLGSAYAQQPGGVLWLNIDNPRLEELLVRVGRAYQVAEITNSEAPLGMVGAVENTLKRHKPFIVLDGRINGDVATRFITRCVTGLPTLILSESRIEGPWTALMLDKLSPEQSAILFKQEARVTGTTSDIDIHGIVKLFEFLPFAIVIAARAMIASKQAPADYYKLIQQVVAATAGNGPVAALTASFRSLNSALQGLILMMGATFDGRASAELLSTVSNAPLESVQQAMNILAQLNLVERTQRYGVPYYHLHTLTYAFAQSFLRSSNRLDGLQEKVRDAILAYAKKYASGTPDAHTKLATEMDSFLAVARWAAERGQRNVAAELVMALSQADDFVNTRGYLYELQLLRALSTGANAFPAYGEATPALSLDDEDVLDDEEEDFLQEDDEFVDELEEEFDDDEIDLDEELEGDEEDEQIAPLSSRLFTPDDDEDSIDAVVRAVPTPSSAVPLDTGDLGKLRSALAQARQSGDRQKQIEVLRATGKLQVDQNMENEAIATYGEALTLYEALNEQTGMLEMLDMLSALAVKTENSRAAVMYATRGSKLAEALGDSDTRMHLLITLGDARQQLGESDPAMQDYSQALTLARTSDDHQNEALILYKLGYAQLDSGDPEMAIDTWEQALKLFRAQSRRDYEGRVLGALGSAYGDLERWSEAVNFYTSALHIAREVGDKEEEALQLSSLGYAAVQAGQLGQAVLRYRQALHLAYEKDDRDNIVSTIVDLCRLLVESRKHVSVAQVLINDALALEPNDKDVRQLKERIDSETKLAEAYQTAMIAVVGTARDYAANAYKLLAD